MIYSDLYSGTDSAADTAWGKLDRESGAALPLYVHLADAEQVAGWLCDHFVAKSVMARLARDLEGEDSARAAIRFCAATHDVGKLSPAFAFQADSAGHPEVVAAMSRAGLKTHPVQSRVHHTLTGQIAVQQWLIDNHGFTNNAASRIACVIGGHHGVFPNSKDLSDAKRQVSAFGASRRLNEGVWHESRVQLIAKAADLTGARSHLQTWLAHPWPVSAQMLIVAIVIIADWIASNTDFFPYQNPHPERVTEALAALSLPGNWTPRQPPRVDQLFWQRFPKLRAFSISPLQTAVAEVASSCTGPPLMIIEAPMGAGKTEAAQLAAEILAYRFSLNGVYVGLPTMATANPMFDRTLRWLDTMLDQDASVMLAHSKAGHHDRFRGLLHEGRVQQIHDDGEKGRAVAATWLMGRKRATQASFVVGTVDQLLLMALRAKHVALRHLAMAGKVVIVDEVHAADDFMRAYLCRALSWLAFYGTPVILMSATLPPDQRQQLVDAYCDGRQTADRKMDHISAYPLVTTVDDDGHRQISVDHDGRSTRLETQNVTDEDLIERLQDTLHDGGCVGIIHNTVGRAQQTYTALQQVFGDDVLLLHSRFIAQHRAHRERELINALGPDGERPHRLIVVGTQVMEQSLDVDFDLIVSDLAPMDLLLQRAGRSHRHQRPTKARPHALRTPQLWITGCDLSVVPPEIAASSKTVYGAAKLLRAAALIPSEGCQFNLPADIPVLVNAAYESRQEPPAGWLEVWDEADAREKEKVIKQHSEASEFRIVAPDEQETLLGFHKFEATDPESPRSRGKQQVRDTQESLEVIVVQRRADGTLRLPVGIDPHDRVIPEYPHEDIPTNLARTIAATTITLPLMMSLPRNFDAVEAALNKSLEYANWDRSPWLRGQLALVLDETLTSTVAQFTLTYDEQKGLVTMWETNQ